MYPAYAVAYPENYLPQVMDSRTLLMAQDDVDNIVVNLFEVSPVKWAVSIEQLLITHLAPFSRPSLDPPGFPLIEHPSDQGHFLDPKLPRGMSK